MSSLDISEFESAKELAHAIKDHLRERFDIPEDRVQPAVYGPQSNKGSGYASGQYEICWEGGIYDWAVKMSLYDEWEGMKNILDNPTYYFEASTSFAIAITPR